jgi:hypothetical protein
MGIPGRFDEPAFVDALRTVTDATERSGKAAAILLRTAADAPRYLELGYRYHRDRVGPELRHRRGAGGRRGRQGQLASRRLRPQLPSERRCGLGRAARPLAGLGDHDADEDQARADELDRREDVVEEDRGEGDDDQRLDVLTSAAWAAPIRSRPA